MAATAKQEYEQKCTEIGGALEVSQARCQDAENQLGVSMAQAQHFSSQIDDLKITSGKQNEILGPAPLIRREFWEKNLTG